MSDQFGISVAMEAAAQIVIQTSRQTGRTLRMVDGLRDGDHVIFADGRERLRVERLCIERGITIRTFVRDPNCEFSFEPIGASVGRTCFDHSWIEQYFLHEIKTAGARLDRFEREMSGDWKSANPAIGRAIDGKPSIT